MQPDRRRVGGATDVLLVPDELPCTDGTAGARGLVSDGNVRIDTLFLDQPGKVWTGAIGRIGGKPVGGLEFRDYLGVVETIDEMMTELRCALPRM